MLELSLHILDLLENATRAGASIVSVTLRENPDEDLLAISVEDNGPGLAAGPETALDPFYTTKAGKRTGLGLSLFRAAAERTGGYLRLEKSEDLGGAAVHARLCLSHVDRAPLGDLGDTLGSIILTHPEVDVWCRLYMPAGETHLHSHLLAQELGEPDPSSWAVVRRYSQLLRTALAAAKA